MVNSEHWLSLLMADLVPLFSVEVKDAPRSMAPPFLLPQYGQAHLSLFLKEVRPSLEGSPSLLPLLPGSMVYLQTLGCRGA